MILTGGGCALEPDTNGHVTIPAARWNNVVPAYVFSNCPTLVSVMIKPGVTSIGANAFEACTKLKHVSIPTTVIHIGAKGKPTPRCGLKCHVLVHPPAFALLQCPSSAQQSQRTLIVNVCS